MVNQRGVLQLIVGVLIIFVLLILGIGIYSYRNKSAPALDQASLVPSPSVLTSTEVIDTEISEGSDSGDLMGWKTYTSDQCKISFDYPADLELFTTVEHPEFGCRASFGIQGDPSKALIFGTPIGMTREELVNDPENRRIIISGSEGFLKSNPDSFSRAINFIKGSIVFQLFLMDPDNYQDIDSEFDQIIYSVRFHGVDTDYNQTFRTIIPLDE